MQCMRNGRDAVRLFYNAKFYVRVFVSLLLVFDIVSRKHSNVVCFFSGFSA